MHKKPLVAVLILGLLLLVSSVGFAKTDAPYKLNDSGQLLPYIARGIVKEAPTSPTPLSGPTTNIQAGVSRTGATFCDGEWQGGGAYYYGGWLYGDEFYAAYQDPENLGTCTGLPDVYTFDVTAINWFVYVEAGGAPVDYDIQPLVYDNGGDALCPVPGNVLCAGPVYTVSFPSDGGYILTLPFADPCCSYAEYFAGVYVATYSGAGILTIIIDDGGQTETCYTYNDWGSGWYDFGDNQGYNIELWSEGNTWDQNSCPGLPGDCDWVAWYNGIAYYSSNPGGNLIEERFTRYNPDLECTLVATDFYIYGGGSAGTPTAWFSVYGNNGPVFGRMYPGDDAYGPQDPANHIFTVEVAWGDITTYPAAQTIDWSVEDPNWPTGYVYTTGENLFVTEGISPNTPDPVNDVLATLVDAGEGSGGRGGAYFGVVPAYLYFDEAYGSDDGNAMESYFCCQHVDLVEVECSNPGADDWPTWGHDYNRTCATSINVGDPCQITAEWGQPLLGSLNSFCEPTIADNTVYVSNDQNLFSFDLTSGAAGNTVSGLPYIFGTNRGNVTIDGGFVYVTGGTGKSISQWDAALTAANWVNAPGNGAGTLDATVRFGVTAVYDIAGTEVVVVGNEEGLLFCFETATGALYPGWGTNPAVLDEGIWHSPSYDGTDLYVGTSHTPSGEGGSIYRIDAATGATVWNWVGSGASEGFPGGVSLEGNYVYSASAEASGGAFRAKIDKTTGVADWEFGEGSSLYGCPAIGRNFVYIPQDGPGVLVVDKGTGAALYNFAVNGVGSVTQHVTITCDNYLFAGDRSGNWWLLDINNQVPVFSVPFDGVVNGTAVANDGVDDYAVVSVRSGNNVDGGGLVAAFKFNAGVRPRVVQNSFSVNVPVPFGTLTGNPLSEADLLSNNGCADLNVTAVNITDPLPDVSAKSFNEARSRYAAAAANAIVGSDYTAYFDNSTKAARQTNRVLEFVDDELTRGDVAMENAKKALVDSKRSGSRMAAGAQIVRTSAVTVVTNPIPVGSSSNVDWLYDGTGLLRGVDVEEVEFITDDPDRLFFGNQPIFTITYVGGCLDAEYDFVWNTDGAANEQGFYNYGRLADYAIGGAAHIFSWGNDPEDGVTSYYDGSFYLAGTQHTGTSPLTETDSSQFFIADMYSQWGAGGFAGNPKPGTSICGFDDDFDVHMGWKRTGGCPGTAAEILGTWARSYYVDTLQYYEDTPYAAIGTEIALTEVGAYDPEYGDFKLLKWDITERNGVAQGPIYAGTWTDWDVPPSGGSNHGIVSDAFNGYALWDWVTPSYAFGYFDPRMSTDYCGLNTTEYSPHRIEEMGQRGDGAATASDGNGGYGLWQGLAADGGFEGQSTLWENVVNGAARVQSSATNHENLTADGNYWSEDHFGMLVNKPFSFEGNDTKTVIQAEYGIDVSGVGSEGATDVAMAEADITALARRAAIWSGFARGDANMDGCVNLIDVCWLGSGNQIYPDDYNGDVDLSGGVDAADASYLLQYVTGIGPAPQGEWRFTF
jgi:hypothetical protein